MSGARDDIYQVAALLDELERALNPLALEERGEIVSTPVVPPALPQAPRGGGLGIPGRGPSSPGPGQSRRTSAAAPVPSRAREEVLDELARPPTPRRTPPPPRVRRGEVAREISGAPGPTVSPPPRARDILGAAVLRRAVDPVVAASVPREASPIAPQHAPVLERAIVHAAGAAPAIPRAAIRDVAPMGTVPGVAAADPAVASVLRAVAAPEVARPVAPVRPRPAPPAKRLHARAPVAAAAAPSDDAPAALPGERIAAPRRAIAAPAHRHRALARRAEPAMPASRPRRARGAAIARAVIAERDRAEPPPLPRRPRVRLDAPASRGVTGDASAEPPPAPVLDDDDDLEVTAARDDASHAIWLRGGRLRWVASPALLERADRALARLVRKRGRRL